MTTTYQFQQLDPQCARGKFSESLMTDPAWTAEIKYDGDRRIAQFCATGLTEEPLVRFTGRKKSVKDGRFVEKTFNVPHLSRARFNGNKLLERNMKALHGTVLDGEMVVDLAAVAPAFRAQLLADTGGRSKWVTSIMGSSAEEAVRKQEERGWLRYVVFDCLFYKGRDVRHLPQRDRRAFAFDAVAAWGNPHATVAYECTDPRNKQAWLDGLWAAGEEGIILKDTSAPYGKKFQSRWVKVKNVINAEAFIIGYEDAKETSKKVNGDVSVTKFAALGWIGAVKLGQYRDGKVWECATVSGMDEGLRRELSENGKKYLRRVVRIKANARETSGRFRHPQWQDWCDDKNPQDCVYREDES